MMDVVQSVNNVYIEKDAIEEMFKEIELWILEMRQSKIDIIE